MSAHVIKTKIKMIELGIAPAITAFDLSLMLESMSSSERRKANRKFRKLWKKIEKKDPHSKGFLMTYSGFSERTKKRNRCVIVAKSIIDSCY